MLTKKTSSNYRNILVEEQQTNSYNSVENWRVYGYVKLEEVNDLVVEEEEIRQKIIYAMKNEKRWVAEKLADLEKAGFYDLTFDFDYSDFTSEQKITIFVRVEMGCDILQELNDDDEDDSDIEEKFTLYLSKDSDFLEDRRCDALKSTMYDSFLDDFDSVLLFLIDQRLFADLYLNFAVVEKFLNENWYPFLNDDGTIRKAEYGVKMLEMVSEFGWDLPKDVDWDIQKSIDFVEYLRDNASSFDHDNYEEEVGIRMGDLFTDRPSCPTYLPACVLSLYFFADIFGFVCCSDKKRSVPHENIIVQNYRDEVPDENGNLVREYVDDSDILNSTGFSPVCYSISLDLSRHFERLSKDEIVHSSFNSLVNNNLGDFEDYQNYEYLSEVAFGGVEVDRGCLDIGTNPSDMSNCSWFLFYTPYL